MATHLLKGARELLSAVPAVSAAAALFQLPFPADTAVCKYATKDARLR